MGKKYIIEMEDKPFHKEDGYFLYRVKGFNSLVFDMTGIGMLTPYTEPDLEQVRKEAYDEGYDDAKGGYENGFENGMIVAWDAARKISLAKIDGGFSWESMNDIFGTENPNKIYKTFTVSEAIEKIRQYEQEQEEQIQVGDEVIPRETEYDDMIVTRLWKDDYDYDYIDAIGYDGRTGSFLVSRVSKTGKHYEIAEVLAKMKESDNG